MAPMATQHHCRSCSEPRVRQSATFEQTVTSQNSLFIPDKCFCQSLCFPQTGQTQGVTLNLC